MIELYPHNQRAYDALCAMLDERGKACLVQPCGTGKAMIGFHYTEDHPRERVLWLSPSDYIFSEQNANLKREGGAPLSNVEQMTYAAAMARAKRGERMPHADAIILDEFHHCGAPEWSKGVVAVLERSPPCQGDRTVGHQHPLHRQRARHGRRAVRWKRRLLDGP